MNNLDILYILEDHIAKFNEFTNATASFAATLMQILQQQGEQNQMFYDQIMQHMQAIQELQSNACNMTDQINAQKSILIDHEQRIKNLEQRNQFDAPPDFDPPRSH